MDVSKKKDEVVANAENKSANGRYNNLYNISDKIVQNIIFILRAIVEFGVSALYYTTKFDNFR